MNEMIDLKTLEVIDSSIKIGLGALIGGFFSWIVARQHTQSNVQRFQMERRSKILSEVAQVYEDIFQSWHKFSSQLLSTAHVNALNQKESDPIQIAASEFFISENLKNATQLRIEMCTKLQNVFKSQSQLKLLGENKCETEANNLCLAISDADAFYKFNGQTYVLEGWESVHKAVRDAREKFYKEMSKRF